MFKLIKLIALIPFLLSLISCVSDYERDEELFDFYEYYTTFSDYQYELLDSVETVNSLSTLSFKTDQSWSYGASYSLKEVRVTAIIDSNITRFTLFDNNGYGAETYDIILNEGTYAMSKTSSSNWDSTRVIEFLPIPHISQLKTNYKILFIKMDDSSICYSVDSGIYSTRFGRITHSDGILVEYNGEYNDSVALALNEYLAKRGAWFQ